VKLKTEVSGMLNALKTENLSCGNFMLRSGVLWGGMEAAAK